MGYRKIVVANKTYYWKVGRSKLHILDENRNTFYLVDNWVYSDTTFEEWSRGFGSVTPYGVRLAILDKLHDNRIVND